jgi:hypothetical protein
MHHDARPWNKLRIEAVYRAERKPGSAAVPIILWLLGVPLTLIVVLLLTHVI